MVCSFHITKAQTWAFKLGSGTIGTHCIYTIFLIGLITIFTYHDSRFPKDPERRQLWVTNVHWDNWTPSDTSLLCSDHFLEKYINRTGQRITLKNYAVPTRFKAFPQHLKK